MATIFVIRHQGAREWMKKQSIEIDQWTDDIDLNNVKAGDVVIGILPMQLAAEVCEKGAEFIALQINVPKEMRGTELSLGDLEKMNCSLIPYFVAKTQSTFLNKNSF